MNIKYVYAYRVFLSIILLMLLVNTNIIFLQILILKIFVPRNIGFHLTFLSNGSSLNSVNKR